MGNPTRRPLIPVVIALTLAVVMSAACGDDLTGPPPADDVVDNALLQSLSLQPGETDANLNETVSFTAIGHYSDGSNRDVTELATWSSHDTGVVTIGDSAADKGVAHAVGDGDTDIEANLDVHSAQARFRVGN